MGILLLCSSIISFNNASNDDSGAVNFCHQSVKDFLLDGDSASRAAWYRTSPDGANLLMFENCWRYLSSDEFTSGMLFVSHINGTLVIHNREVLQAQYCFLQYAGSEWGGHALASYPAVLNELTIDIAKAPTLRDTWLLRAVAEGNGQEAVVELLITTEGVNVNLKDWYFRTPLSLAAENGHDGILKLLLATEKVDVGPRSSFVNQPLLLAAENGHDAVVKLLLATPKVDPNLENMYGLTPLLQAAKNGHTAVVKLLLATQRVDVALKDELGQTPLSLAAENGYEDIVKLLLATEKVDVDPRVHEYGFTPLSLATKNRHEAVVKLLLATQVVDVDWEDKFGQTPLSLATRNGHEAIVKLLKDFKYG